MNRFFLIDKPLNITSFDVIRQLRKKLNIRKIGHTGTLDPLASGALLVATGNYTKLIPYFEKDKKTYEFEISFDGISDSFDLGTEVKYLSNGEKEFFKDKITRRGIEDVLKDNFSGKIKQIPPKYSAIKINGKKALDKVLKLEDFEIPIRECTIFDIKLNSFKYPLASFTAEVSAGTYIRSIANDLGSILGTGGYITKLRRTKIGDLDISLAQKLDNFDELSFLNLKNIFGNRIFTNFSDNILKNLNNGLPFFGEFDYKIGEDILVSDGENITNIVNYDGEKLIPKRKIL